MDNVRKIIFIEGVSGVGKSTTATKLSSRLTSLGFSVDTFLEFDFNNPIDFYSTAYFSETEYKLLLEKYSNYKKEIELNSISLGERILVRYYNKTTPLFGKPLLSELKNEEFCYKPQNPVSLAEYRMVYSKVWDNFTRNINSYKDIIIFDGSLLHHPINDLIRNYNASKKEIVSHINLLLRAIENLDVLLVYLKTNNIPDRLTNAHISRNQSKPTLNQIEFWEERYKNDLEVTGQISINNIICNVGSGCWDSIVDDIVTKLNVDKQQK